MAVAWNKTEIELIVLDYIAMLIKERRSIRYSKKAHRDKLLPLLNNRSHGSVEYKHQNISAVLLELHHPIIDGYKPAINYQGGEFPKIVRNEVLANQELAVLLTAQAEDHEVQLPSVTDILSVLVNPPTLAEKGAVKNAANQYVPKKVDYLAREAKNQVLGLKGEEFALNFETARLLAEGKDHLARMIEHLSLQDDTAGYDIHSYDSDGRDRFIEVKTTRYSRYTPFFLSENERQIAQNLGDSYHLYRLFEFDKEARLFQLPGAFEKNFRIVAKQYQAHLA